ncbi:MAG: DUF4880 domain-containing protein, partial [Gammaproteobacteria bacterium]|nr:DUF4880 domain-containing protein [Gammaproteobacteria bacterium]
MSTGVRDAAFRGSDLQGNCAAIGHLHQHGGKALGEGAATVHGPSGRPWLRHDPRTSKDPPLGRLSVAQRQRYAKVNESDQHQHARIKDEAAGWVVKLNSGRLSGDDAYAFEVWLHENGDHRREFAAHARVWQGAATATERPGDADPISVRRVVAAWAKAHPIRATIRLVGSCLAILAVAFVVDRHLEPPLEHLAAHTEIGQSKRVELADGSTVQLNTDSGITADYSSEERAVKLE